MEWEFSVRGYGTDRNRKCSSTPPTYSVAKMMATKNCAEVQVVCSRITLYYNCRIELKWKRSLHHCEKCDLFRGEAKGWGSKCGAIHFGRCTPVSFPFPQNYCNNRRKGSQQNASIPVAKVSPTRPAAYAHQHSSPQHVLICIYVLICSELICIILICVVLICKVPNLFTCSTNVHDTFFCTTR